MPETLPELDPKYRIGVAEMDAQHARWIALIEKFRAAAAGHLLDRAGFDAAHEALDKLLEYTRMHFASEEELLTRHGYPELREHRLKHQRWKGRSRAWPTRSPRTEPNRRR